MAARSLRERQRHEHSIQPVSQIEGSFPGIVRILFGSQRFQR
jgi:hypothetical protein